MNTQMLSEITSRLVEVVCETAEEMQGFVTEILQTIEKAVSSLDIGVIGMSVDASLRGHTEAISTGLSLSRQADIWSRTHSQPTLCVVLV